jgi:hypothetical protein
MSLKAFSFRQPAKIAGILWRSSQWQSLFDPRARRKSAKPSKSKLSRSPKKKSCGQSHSASACAKLYFPKRCRFFVLTLPDHEIRWLPEQANGMRGYADKKYDLEFGLRGDDRDEYFQQVLGLLGLKDCSEYRWQFDQLDHETFNALIAVAETKYADAEESEAA